MIPDIDDQSSPAESGAGFLLNFLTGFNIGEQHLLVCP
jgi:hypothetical protein